MTKILPISVHIDPDIYGTKAFNIHRLYIQEYAVPFAFCFPMVSSFEEFLNKFEIHMKQTLNHFEISKGIFKLAIRSSGNIEDQDIISNAGIFSSFLGEGNYSDLIHKIKNIFSNSLRNVNNAKIGLIFQEFIEFDYSGIIFSAHVHTGDRNRLMITYTVGNGQKLTSGLSPGNDLIYNLGEGKLEEPIEFISHEFKELMNKLTKFAKEIENYWNTSVDIEWGIFSNKIYLLQSRPITGIIFSQSELFLLQEKNLAKIPPIIRNDVKIRLNILAQSKGIKTFDTFILNLDIRDYVSKKFILEKGKILQFSDSIASNLLMIYPESNVRETKLVCGEEFPIESEINNCQRYSLRKNVSNRTFDQVIGNIVNKLSNNYLKTIIMIIKIKYITHNGIISLSKEGFIIEICKGHFVTKGKVNPSIYSFDDNLNLVSQNTFHQRKSYIPFEENILQESHGVEERVNIIPVEPLHKIINVFRNLLSISNLSIEFGINFDGINLNDIYFIDVSWNKEENLLSHDQIEKKVISHGFITGKAYFIKNISPLKRYFKNNENVIFFYERPDIALIELINKFSSNKIGFVFNNGSILSHLPIILRERQIPAIIDPNAFLKISNNTIFEINTNY